MHKYHKAGKPKKTMWVITTWGVCLLVKHWYRTTVWITDPSGVVDAGVYISVSEIALVVKIKENA
jgi:hypothetical protein